MSNNCSHPCCCGETCRRPKQQKARQPIKRKKQKRYIDMDVELFFEYAASEIEKNPFCWNCGAYISPSDYRNSTCHIFPKNLNSGFPSVAAHPYNFIIGGNRCGCHNLTHRLDTFSKMKVWPIAVERFRKFEGEIKETRKYLPLFLEYARHINKC